MIFYGLKNNRGCRHFSVVFDSFSQNEFAFPLKNKTAQTKTNEFSIFFQKPNLKTSLDEKDVENEFVNKILECF